MIQEIIHSQGNIIWRREALNLAGKEYIIPEVAVNLNNKYANSNQIKNFKNAYELSKRDKSDKLTYNNENDVEEAINILEDQLKNKQNVAIVIKSIIENNTRIFKEFNERYDREYRQYLSKK